MSIETVKMSTKGQIVIPRLIRESIGAYEGSVFAVTNTEDTLVLKKIAMPTKEELISNLSKIAKEGKARLEKKGIREADLHEK